MPMIDPRQSLARRPRRVLVAGTSGAGKTTLAARIATLLGIEHVEIDALYHGSNWIPRDQFLTDVEEFSSQPQWVTEWQYGTVRDLLADRADLLVWLDLPRVTVMRQVITRTIRRRLRREVLWNGNIEPPLHRFLLDRDHIVRWAWTTHHKSELRISALAQRRPDLTIVRIRGRVDVEHWLAGPFVGTLANNSDRK
ncbi:AAA family ATPase [Rhodococcus sp. NPDC019627]|uniref:AAA family ATPase n=2 Tax=Rhodococcus TaxID=1827 RepID=UPI00378DC36E